MCYHDRSAFGHLQCVFQRLSFDIISGRRSIILKLFNYEFKIRNDTFYYFLL
jgi:hypothetical protein